MGYRKTTDLPSALDKKEEIFEKLTDGRPAVFFDYDGTLTPIVSDPARAMLSEKTKGLLQELSKHWTVVIMSGRALADVRELVALDTLIYAGSHGMEVSGPDDSFHEEPMQEFLPVLDTAERELRETIADLKVRIERKPYAIAVHYRQASEDVVPELEKRVHRVADAYPELDKTGGKKIFELRPRSEWNKGKALLHLIKKLHTNGARIIPLFIGDDNTDEDAFRSLADQGIGIRTGYKVERTTAHYTLKDPCEVTAFMEELVRYTKNWRK